MDFQTLERNIKRLSDSVFLERLIIDAVEKHKTSLINLVKDQIRYGVKGDGSRTLKYTDDGTSFNPSRYYVRVKQTKAPQFPFRNYENEGNFLGSMFANAKDIEIFIGSTDKKASMIEEQEENLFGLTDENKQEFAKIWVPTFIKMFKDEILK